MRILKQRFFVLFLISAVLFMIPLLWNINLSLYNIGGDDSRLYFLYPYKWLHNVALYAWYGTAFGHFIPQYFWIPFILLLCAIKGLSGGLNVQRVYYGLMFVLEFLSSYLVCSEIIKMTKLDNSRIVDIASIMASLLYVFNPINYLWLKNPFITVLIRPYAYPLLLYFLIRAYNKSDIKYVLIGSLISPIFAPSFIDPSFLSFIMTVFILCALLITFKLMNIKKVAIILVVYAISFISVNSFWIIPELLSKIIILRLPHVSLSSVKAIAIPSKLIWFISLVPYAPSTYFINTFTLLLCEVSGVLMFLIIFMPLVFYYRYIITEKIGKIYIVFLTLLTISLYFVCVHIDNGIGIRIYEYFMKFIPFFSIFRTFYRVWDIDFTILLSICLSVSLYIILKVVHNNTEFMIKNKASVFTLLILILLLTLISIEAYPLIKGLPLTLPICKSCKRSFTRNLKFPLGYLSLIKFVSQHCRFRVIEFPLLKGDWSAVVYHKGAYIGISPFKVLGGIYTIDGYLSLYQISNYNLSLIIERYLINHRYEYLRLLFNILGIRCVILDYNLFKILTPQRVGSVNSAWNCCAFQTIKFVNDLISTLNIKLIKKFNDYLVFELSNQRFIYASNRYYLCVGNIQEIIKSLIDKTNINFDIVFRVVKTKKREVECEEVTLGKFTPSVKVVQSGPSYYVINISNIKNGFILVLSDNYDKGWKVYAGRVTNIISAIVKRPLNLKHIKVNGYANGWIFSEKIITRLEKLEHKNNTIVITIYFYPQTYLLWSSLISIITMIIIIIVIIAPYRRYRFLGRQ